MSGEKGRNFLLKLGTVASSPVTIAGGQALSLTINNEEVDVTTKDSAGMQTLLEGAGTQTLSMNISGVFIDSAAGRVLFDKVLANSIDAYSIFWENTDTLEGSFQVSNFEETGEHNGPLTFTATLTRSGDSTYTNN